MPTNSLKGLKIDPTPVEKRRGIKVGDRAREAYAKRDRSKDDPDSPVLSPDQWAKAMRRDEYFRPVKKLTAVRIDADILAWLRSKGAGHLSRINDILRKAMMSEVFRSKSK